jgi:hypothetical protein
MEAGIEIDRSDEQYENAPLPKLDSWQPGSNVKTDSLQHFTKQLGRITWIDETR